jgi:hypothetical protein
MQDRPIRGIPNHVTQYQKLASDILDELSARIVLLTRCCGFDGPAHWSIRFVCPGDLRPRISTGMRRHKWNPTLVRIRVRRERQPGSRGCTQKAFWACVGAAEGWPPAGPALSLSTLCAFKRRRPPGCAAGRPVQRGTLIDTINSSMSAIGQLSGVTSLACRGSKPLRYEQMAVMYDLMSYCWCSRPEDWRIQTTLTNWWLNWRDGPGELVALFLRQESSSIPPPAAAAAAAAYRDLKRPQPPVPILREVPP